MICVNQINVKYVFHKNCQAHKRFKTYCIFLVAEVMNASIWLVICGLPSNLKRSSTGVILKDQNIYDILYMYL